ncbi:hypothetical protein ACIREE_40485 [Streptomyces sp. NPDC102467]|uniref:hypothetical protein n=1 Tax=Streptomyces sp. NPDC102467 TaxID=3366179 RepID=UPI00380ED0AF
MAVDVLADDGDEQAARLCLPPVEHGRRVRGHRAVTLNRPADDFGDLAEAERNHARPLDVMPGVVSVMPRVKAAGRIAGISKTTYVPTTARRLD